MNVFFNYQKKEIITCPLCKSLVQAENMGDWLDSMLRNLKNNENGIVFVTVLMIVVVIMTITVGIISLNVSQVTFTEQEVQRIKTEMLAQGMVAYVYSNRMTGVANNSFIFNEVLDGINYVINADIAPSEALTITIDY